MPRNGSGTYVLPTNSWNPATNGNSATAADWQSLIDDVESAVSQSLSADGQKPMSGNLNANNNKITNLAAGSASGDSLRWQQLFSQGSTNQVPSAATVDIGAQNTNFIEITGTTTITSLGANYNGPRFLRFTGVLILTHNATTLNLPGSANITTAVGDTCTAIPNSSANGWNIVDYQRFALAPGTASSIAGGAAGNIPIQSAAGTTVFYTGQLAGTRNKFINGAIGIDQRNAGAAQTITAAAELAYTVDRWYAYCTGANVTGQRVAGTAPNKFNYQFTGAASVTKIGFAQRIEAANCQDLAGQTATLSVDLANSLLTTVTWTAWYANTEDTFGTLASPTRTQIATGSFTVNSTLARYSTQISIPSAATTGIEVEFSVGAQTSGTWTIGRAQLEGGSVATAFEYRDVASELARCQRYFYAFPIGAVSSGANGTATNVYYYSYAFKQSMRVTPTSVSTGSFTTNNCSLVGSALGTDFARIAATITATAGFAFENAETWNWSAEL